MKIRSGFVSNSSSASFVVTWKKYYSDPKKDLKQNLDNIFQYSDFKPEELEVIFKDIIANTKEISNDIYETLFWTVMFNGVHDFGKAATQLIAAVAIDNLLVSAKSVMDYDDDIRWE